MPVTQLSAAAPTFIPRSRQGITLLDFSEREPSEQVEEALGAFGHGDIVTHAFASPATASLHEVASGVMRALDGDAPAFDAAAGVSTEPKDERNEPLRRFNRKADPTSARQGFSLGAVARLHPSAHPPAEVKRRISAGAQVAEHRLYTLAVTELTAAGRRRFLTALSQRFGAVALYGGRSGREARVIDLEHGGWARIARPPSPAHSEFELIETPSVAGSDGGSDGVLVGE